MRHTITSPEGGLIERGVVGEHACIGGEIRNEFLFFYCVKERERDRKKVNKERERATEGEVQRNR